MAMDGSTIHGGPPWAPSSFVGGPQVPQVPQVPRPCTSGEMQVRGNNEDAATLALTSRSMKAWPRGYGRNKCDVSAEW